MLKVQKRKCSICKKDFVGFGHNPEPVLPYKKRCCDACNIDVVIPIRIFGIANKEAMAFLKGGKK